MVSGLYLIFYCQVFHNDNCVSSQPLKCNLDPRLEPRCYKEINLIELCCLLGLCQKPPCVGVEVCCSVKKDSLSCFLLQLTSGKILKNDLK